MNFLLVGIIIALKFIELLKEQKKMHRKEEEEEAQPKPNHKIDVKFLWLLISMV